jgi:tetratricopeptide (TPR) repeat protein
MTTDRTTALAEMAARHHAAGELAVAAERYGELLAIAPSALGYAGLGSVLLDRFLPAAALAVFDSGLRRFPGTRQLAEGRALCLDRQKLTAAALAAYQAVLAAHPDSDLAWNNLGSLLNRAGRNAEALTAFERALALAPGQPVYQSNLLLGMNYSDALSAGTLADRHRQWPRPCTPTFLRLRAGCVWAMCRRISAVTRWRTSLARCWRAMTARLLMWCATPPAAIRTA